MMVGAFEMLVLLVLVFVFFGGGKLPEVMGAIGKSTKEFREGAKEAEGKKASDDAPR